jgi:hypothetical protein
VKRFCPRFEKEAFTHFDQEPLDLANDGGLQAGLRIAALLVQP